MPRVLPIRSLTPRARGTARLCRARRGGVVCILAMLFLVLFAVLAVGFAEAEMMNVQVSRNERFLQQSRTAADSGLGFIRYHLSAITLPPGTTSTNLLANLAAKLAANLNGTTNMGGKTVAVTAGAIYIPSQTTWISADPVSGSRFRITITQSGSNLVVTSRGCGPTTTLTRGVQLQFVPAPRPYALIGLNSLTMGSAAYSDSYDASKGAYVKANAHSWGSVASNGNITLSNTAKVNGDVRYGTAGTLSVAPTATVTGASAPLNKNVSYASVTLPAAGTYTDLGDVTQSSGTLTVPAGTYLINNLNLSGTAKIVWSGPVKLYIKTSYNVTQNVVIQTYNNLPTNRQLYFLPTCATASWSGTNVCVGDLYAPDTAFTISGSVEKFGRVIAKSINNSSTGGMHYDESLTAPNGQASYAPDLDTYLEVP